MNIRKWWNKRQFLKCEKDQELYGVNFLYKLPFGFWLRIKAKNIRKTQAT